MGDAAGRELSGRDQSSAVGRRSCGDRRFDIEGRPETTAGEEPDAVYRIVMPGYFQTMRLPLLRGRDDYLAVTMCGRQEWSSSTNEQHISTGRGTIRSDNGSPLTTARVMPANLADRDWGGPRMRSRLDWAAEPYPEVYLAALQNRRFFGRLAARLCSAYDIHHIGGAHRWESC